MPTYNLKVSELVHLSKNAKAIRVNLDKKLFLFQPGQFVMMELDLEKTNKFKVKDGKKPIQKRPFSMSSTPLRKDYLEVTVKTTENAFVSDYFVNYLNKDEEIIVSGPFGKFYFDEKNTEENIMLIGAGSGISPLMSIFRFIHEKKLPISVHMLYSNKTQEEILWRKEIESLCKSPNLSHEFTLTREEWEGTKGRINKEMILRGLNSKDTHFYLCGPPEFVKSTELILLNKIGIKAENIKKEVYS